MNKLSLKIITLEKVVYEDTVESVSIPTRLGRISVRPGHVALVGLLAPGELLIRKGDNQTELAVTSGFLDIRQNSEVVLLADTADRLEDMNIEEIEKAKARVEQLMKQKQSISNVEFAHLEDVLGRELARLNIANRYRSRRSSAKR